MNALGIIDNKSSAPEEIVGSPTALGNQVTNPSGNIGERLTDLCPCGTAKDFTKYFDISLPEPRELRCEENEGQFDPSLFIVQGRKTTDYPRVGITHKYPKPESISCVVIDELKKPIAISHNLTEEQFMNCRLEIEKVVKMLRLKCTIYND